MPAAHPTQAALPQAPLLLVPPELPAALLALDPPASSPPSPHQLATEVSDIRREIARLQRREALLLASQQVPPRAGPRPGWPMQRLR